VGASGAGAGAGGSDVRCSLSVSAPELAAAIASVPRVHVGALDMPAFLAARAVPPDVADLLGRMLAWNPAARLTCAQALAHPALILPPYAPPPLPSGSRAAAAASAAAAAASAAASAAAPSASELDTTMLGSTGEEGAPMDEDGEGGRASGGDASA
jgi:hypothetical protein